jgi:fibronectin type 3 domain-containing protein
LLTALAVVFLYGLPGCSGYSHIPLASKQGSDDGPGTVQVTLKWNPVPGAVSYNVYWTKNPGVTRYNSYKITDAANPIVITGLDSAVTYYFVVTVVGDSGESKESREMSFAGAGAEGGIDFKDLFDQQAPVTAPSAVEPVKSPTAKSTAVATAEKKNAPVQAPAAGSEIAQYSGKAQATLAWDSVPDAISYNIYWRNRRGVTKQNGKKIENVSNPHTMKNLVPGKTYYLVVTAVGKDGESSISEEISYTAK